MKPIKYSDLDNTQYLIRSLQGYLLLIEYASQQKTLEYQEFSDRLKYGAPIGMSKILDQIEVACAKSNLPPLHALVVSKPTELPVMMVQILKSGTKSEQYTLTIGTKILHQFNC